MNLHSLKDVLDSKSFFSQTPSYIFVVICLSFYLYFDLFTIKNKKDEEKKSPMLPPACVLYVIYYRLARLQDIHEVVIQLEAECIS